MSMTQYTTQTGDTIYTIAFRAYGDALAYQGIIEANPTLPITSVYPAGLVVMIPILENATVATGESLPPWKR